MLVAKAMLDSRVLDMPFCSTLVEMAVFGQSSVDKMAAIKVIISVDYYWFCL
jgi:hypothetical protein